MKTKIILISMAVSLCLAASGQSAYAEKEIAKSSNPLYKNGLNYVSFGAEIGPTLNRFNSSYPVHFGLPVKVYLGRQKVGRFIIRTGYHHFPVPSDRLDASQKRAYNQIIPLAIGYRRNIRDWYIEGSLGAAINQSTSVYNDPAQENWVVSYREINYGLEIGRQIGDFDIGLVVYNTGPIPYHILFSGIKTSYRIKW
ncbi:hypothetical protein ACFOUP_01210 [Belliella kenyensis]|uniref:Outer membrane protein beta-barrel domain-containing protein n=1 Tax=Belliella kenyensis TaxID=1472724 RepID=A0ABV8EFE7_9BACT|nr:hypothetical protein [Belliella kenyensis]MCH7401187.1 hypothetical protein [Belliella kenyensis]MDN3604184.1 hypothetical protein [Belliella kenyensis]